MVAALDREVAADRMGFPEARMAATRGVEFRLQMRVRQKQEREALVRPDRRGACRQQSG